MKNFNISYMFLGLLVAASLLGYASCVSAADEDPSRIWIEQPWEYRYVIKIESPDDYKRLRVSEQKEISIGKRINFYNLEPLFPLVVSITTDPEHYRGEDKAIGAMVVQFDKDGLVTTPNQLSLNLHGRLNRLNDIVLSSGKQTNSLWFHVGYHDVGRDPVTYEDYSPVVPCPTDTCLPDDPVLTPVFAPAICDLVDQSDYSGSRYKKGYKATIHSSNGNFGCREWGYYLQHQYIPYIDVTSYGKDKSTYIRPIIGWGRFDVPPKPIIGKHGKVWVCLHECPNGEAPGIIPDIKQWAARNGWPVPKPPKRQPMFLDREYKRGEFVD